MDTKNLRARLRLLRGIQLRNTTNGTRNPRIDALIAQAEQELDAATARQDHDEAEAFGLGLSFMDWLILFGAVALGIGIYFH